MFAKNKIGARITLDLDSRSRTVLVFNEENNMSSIYIVHLSSEIIM